MERDGSFSSSGERASHDEDGRDRGHNGEEELEDVSVMPEIEDIETESVEEEIPRPIHPPKDVKGMVFWFATPTKFSVLNSILFVIVLQISLGITGFIFGFPYTFALCLTFLVFPVFWMWASFYRSSSTRAALQTQTFYESFSLGILLGIALFVVQWALFTLIFGVFSVVAESVQSHRLILWQVFILCIIFYSFIVEALPEEILRYTIVFLMRRRRTVISRYSTVAIAIAATAGMSTFSSCMFVARTYWTINFEYGWIVWAIEGFMSLTVHMICALWIGVGHSKQQFPNSSSTPPKAGNILVRPWLFHGTYSTFVYIVVMTEGTHTLGWKLFLVVLAFAMVFVLAILAYTILTMKKKILDPQFYNILAEDDVGVPSDPNINSASDPNAEDQHNSQVHVA